MSIFASAHISIESALLLLIFANCRCQADDEAFRCAVHGDGAILNGSLMPWSGPQRELFDCEELFTFSFFPSERAEIFGSCFPLFFRILFHFLVLVCAEVFSCTNTIAVVLRQLVSV